MTTTTEVGLDTRLMAVLELVSTFDFTADRVTVDAAGITIAGDLLDVLPDLIPALALTPAGAEAPGIYRGETFDGIPVTIEQRRD